MSKPTTKTPTLKARQKGIVEMVPTHQVTIPQLTPDAVKELGRPIVEVRAPLNVGVIEPLEEGEEPLPEGWVAVRFKRPSHIAAYPADWVVPVALP